MFTAGWVVAEFLNLRTILYNSQLFWMGQWIGVLYGLYKTTDLSGRTALSADFADTTAKYRKAEFEAASLSF
jgi:hypothetical protein